MQSRAWWRLPAGYDDSGESNPVADHAGERETKARLQKRRLTVARECVNPLASSRSRWNFHGHDGVVRSRAHRRVPLECKCAFGDRPWHEHLNVRIIDRVTDAPDDHGALSGEFDACC